MLARVFIKTDTISHEPNVINKPTTAAVAIDLPRVCKLGLPPEIIKKKAANTIIKTAIGKEICHHKRSIMFLPTTNKSHRVHLSQVTIAA